jgi:hypothetical protein
MNLLFIPYTSVQISTPPIARDRDLLMSFISKEPVTTTVLNMNLLFIPYTSVRISTPPIANDRDFLLTLISKEYVTTTVLK